MPASCLLPARGACAILTGARFASAGLAALRNRVLHKLKCTVTEAVATPAPEPVDSPCPRRSAPPLGRCDPRARGGGDLSGAGDLRLGRQGSTAGIDKVGGMLSVAEKSARRFAKETPLGRTRRARKIHRILAEVYPNARCELDFETPFQLLVATVLSAPVSYTHLTLPTILLV